MKAALIILSFLLLLVHVPLCGAADDQQPYYIVEDPWPPYTYGDSGQTPTSGLAVELVQAVFNRIDAPLRLELLPWKRCIELAKTGHADALMLTVKTDERLKFFHFSEPFFSNLIVFLYRKDDRFSWNTFKDLKQYRLGLVRGSEYSQQFNEAIGREQLQVERVATITQNLDKLLLGRIDATPVLKAVARELIRETPRFQNKFSIADKPLHASEMHMALSRKSRIMNIADQIDTAITALKADGTVEKITTKYLSH